MSETYTILTFDYLPHNFQGLVYSKWLKSLRHGNDLFKLTFAEAYFEAYSKYITKILETPGMNIRFAVLTSDLDVVAGFVVHRGDVLDYAYVDKDARKAGVARTLVPKGITTFTHLTKTGMILWNKPEFKHLKFNPFA